MAARWSCPTCGCTFERGGPCPHDGVALVPYRERPDPLVGTTVGGYVLRQRLGAGGMGTVYRAAPTAGGDEVALKLVHPSEQPADDVARRFLREARLSAQLDSPHIVRTLDLGQTPDGQLYLALELVRGETLKALVHRSGPLPQRRVIQLGLQLCDALTHAHGRQVIHRDLKPANVMISPGPPERLQVLDFGLARGLDDTRITHSDLVVGSANAVAPEVIGGALADVRSDLYALGAVLYTMLEGEQPFGTVGNMSEILVRQLAGTPRPFGQQVIAPLVELVRRLLEVDPAHRPASAADVRARLEALLELTPALPVEVEVPPAPRLGMLVAGGALVLALLGMLWWARP